MKFHRFSLSSLCLGLTLTSLVSQVTGQENPPEIPTAPQTPPKPRRTGNNDVGGIVDPGQRAFVPKPNEDEKIERIPVDPGPGKIQPAPANPPAAAPPLPDPALPDPAGPAPEPKPVKPAITDADRAEFEAGVAAGEAAAPGEEPAVGQGIVEGLIFDSKSSAGLSGATISLAGQFDRTGPDGRFRLADIPAGKQELRVVKSGFKPVTLTVTVKANGSISQEIALEERPVETDNAEYQLEEFTFVEEFEEEEEKTELNLGGANTTGLASGLGKEELSRAAASDAGQAVSKISGANIVGGKFAVVRGLGDRYSNTIVNGALIPSADPSRKAVQLDLFPSELLQSVNIFKTLQADRPGEYTGGLIAIETLALPSENVTSISVGTSYQPNIADGKPFRTVDRPSLNFFADIETDPFGSLITDFGSIPTFPNGILNDRVYLPQVVDAGLRGALPLFSSEEDVLDPGIDFSALISRLYELGPDSKAGFVISFTREQENSYRSAQRARISRLDNPLNQAQVDAALPGLLEQVAPAATGGFTGVGIQSLRDQETFSQQVNWGVLVSGSYQIDSFNTVGATYFKNRSGESEVTISGNEIRVDDDAGLRAGDALTGRSFFQDGGPTNLVTEVNERLFRELEIKQLYGSHTVELTPHQTIDVSWTYSDAETSERRPATVLFEALRFDGFENRPGGGLSFFQPSNPFLNNQIVSTLNAEEAAYRGVDLEVPLLTRLTKPTDTDADYLNLKFGWSSYEKETITRGLDLGLGVRQRDIDTFNEGFEPLDDLLSGRTPAEVFDRPRLFSNSNVVYASNGNTELNAGYLLGKGRLGEWDFSGGVRYEKEVRGFDVDIVTNNRAVRNSNNAQGEQTNTYLLPSIQIGRTFGYDQEHKVELAWSRSVARPLFFEFAPTQRFDPTQLETFAGNPDVRDAVSDNFDLRYSWKDSSSRSFSASIFFKQITDPLSNFRDAQGNLSVINFPQAALGGLELEFFQDFGNGFSFTANGSFVNASLDPIDAIVGQPANRLVLEADALPGQADYLANLILSYNHEDSPWSGSLIYNFTDAFPFIPQNQFTTDPVTEPVVGNVIREARHSLDFVLNRDFSWFGETEDARLSFKVRNVLNAPVSFVYEGSSLPPFLEYNDGPEFSLSMSAKF